MWSNNPSAYIMLVPRYRHKLLYNNALYIKQYKYGSNNRYKEFMVLNKKPKLDRVYF